MTHDEWETAVFVDEATDRFHQSTGKYPTTEEAIRTIRRSRLTLFGPVRKHFCKDYVRVRSYQRSAALELIRLLEEHPHEDPIKVIYEFYCFWDDMLGNANGGFSSRFSMEMRDAVNDVLDILR